MNWQILLQIGSQVVPILTTVEGDIAAVVAVVNALRGAGYQADTDALTAAIADDDVRAAISKAIADAPEAANEPASEPAK
jgi:uncharacterized protein YqgV (UPF0045/DUF77 family)